jgi:two-component system response regulator YesN
MAALTDAYMWAGKALDQSFFEGKGKCYYGSIGSRLKSDNAENLHHAWSELRKRFSKGLADENKEDCEAALQQCFTAWEQKNNKSEIITQARSLVTILWSRKNSLKTEEIMTALMDKIQDILHMGTYKELKDYINIEFHRIWEVDTMLITTVDSGSAHAIQLAMSYIQENYRGELSLQVVADHVHMSRNYFSEQFKRVVGLNFIDFVIRLRIHYAMHLLRQTNIKIYDVGLHAGFNSSKHFLKLFKREVNFTPAEYRQSFGKRSD